jgi:hypothetical protein
MEWRERGSSSWAAGPPAIWAGLQSEYSRGRIGALTDVTDRLLAVYGCQRDIVPPSLGMRGVPTNVGSAGAYLGREGAGLPLAGAAPGASEDHPTLGSGTCVRLATCAAGKRVLPAVLFESLRRGIDGRRRSGVSP